MSYAEILNDIQLPPIFNRNGKDCYLDPIRKKLIYITPEETVRQKVISYILNMLKVPINMVSVEDNLSHYGIKTRERADIIIWQKCNESEILPLAVVECKAPNVPLDDKAYNQAINYSEGLGCQYTILVNGIDFICYAYDEQNGYHRITEVPSYMNMIKGEYEMYDMGELPPRIPFDKLKNEILNIQEDFKAGYATDISGETPMELALPSFNLFEGLMDTRVKMPTGDYGLFKLIEDYGVRMLSYGNGSGGLFFGPYRSFLVDVNNSTEFYSISLSPYSKASCEKTDKPTMTCICVAHDDEKTAHHALQLVVEDNLVVNGDVVKFYHHGRIAIGRIGSGKKDELRAFVSDYYPKIISGDKYYLGQVHNDHLLRLNEPEVIELIVNLISYSIVRDIYRVHVKSKK